MTDSVTSPRLAMLLLLALALFVAVTNTVYVGDNTIYSSGLAEKRRFAHDILLNNAPPPGGWAAHGANGMNIRVGVVYAAEAASRVFRIDVLTIYRLIDLATLTLLVTTFAAFINRLAGPRDALLATLYLASILPLTYEFHVFHPWDRPSWLFWMAGIWACQARRPLLLAAIVILGVTVKYDIIVLPLLYILAWSRRDDLVRPLLQGAAIMACGLATFVALNYLLPGGHSERDVGSFLARNWSYALRAHVTYAPTLAFLLPATLALIGWRNGDRFARAAFLSAIVVAVPLVGLTNFEEVRAEIMLLLLMAPLALAGLSRLLPNR